MTTAPEWLKFTPPARTAGHRDTANGRQSRRRRIDQAAGRPSPWTFGEWLEWAEAVAADKLARAEAFSIAAQPSHPDRARMIADATYGLAPDATRREIGPRAWQHAEEAGR